MKKLMLFVASVALFIYNGAFAQPIYTFSTDPRVENRTYHFRDTGEEMYYSVFVSSKVSPDKKNPLIVILHGWGIGPGYMMQGSAIDLAEEGGYILVAPMGYVSSGGYGAPVVIAREPDPPPSPELSELSEKDVINVLQIMLNEFNVDPDRIYLTGHSMGGGGTLHLGATYPLIWAAIAPIAPGTYAQEPSILDPVKDTLPVMIVQGDADLQVPVESVRLWVDYMDAIGMDYEYIELAGEGHATVIELGMDDVFGFFADHSRAANDVDEDGVIIDEREQAVLTLAESLYPEIFADPDPLYEEDGFVFRYYPPEDITVGLKDGMIHFTGGVFGDEMVEYGDLDAVLAKLQFFANYR